MSVATFQQQGALKVGLVKMEDSKKRAVTSIEDDVTAPPPPKRQATMSNGTAAEERPEVPKFGTVNTPWQTDLDTLQKDALCRQMREYKREKVALETSVSDLETKLAYHQDHLRIVDAWWLQFLDEVRVLMNDLASTRHPSPTDSNKPLPDSSFLEFKEKDQFEEHLGSRTESIKAVIQALCSSSQTTIPETLEYQTRINELLATEKVHIAALQRAQAERDGLQDRLDNASYRYLMAERKLDRQKSQAVASLEMQSQMQSQAMKPDASDANTNGDAVNGFGEAGGLASEDAERERQEAVAVATKVKEQLAQLEEENAKLTKEVTLLKANSTGHTDEEYAKTELFKVVKSQLEDSYNKLNDLEATHLQLREEAKKAQAERTSYRMKIDEESRESISEAEGQLARADADLQRVRAARDDLIAKSSILEASMAERQLSTEQTQALAKAREDRINALEIEVERLKIQAGEAKVELSEEDLAMTDVEELRGKVASLKKEYSLLSNEMPSMEQAWKKAQTLAASKVTQAFQLDETVGRLNAEKAKADQKYFGAMKAKEAHENELRLQRKQNKASSGIITALKETEAKIRDLCTNLEKQLAEDRMTIEVMTRHQHVLEQKANQAGIAETGLQTQVVKLKESMVEKDSLLSLAEHSRREAEQQVEQLKLHLEAAKKKSEEWRVKVKSSSSDEVNNLRRVAYCQCGKNLKDTCIVLCGHILCKTCVDDRLKNRLRKCPVCMVPFGAKDTKTVHLV
ncbi:BRE1-domain-containing protein [Tothia fuscella]|uniref:E3 ubiquitin protein ligase n=1 Tax=Tothia fuscella TaxID=1048955 RepID=A0A9P4NFK2_9PEZI|nr:BRE1-domain-containing protein [Tothia fuscella]